MDGALILNGRLVPERSFLLQNNTELLWASQAQHHTVGCALLRPVPALSAANHQSGGPFCTLTCCHSLGFLHRMSKMSEVSSFKLFLPKGVLFESQKALLSFQHKLESAIRFSLSVHNYGKEGGGRYKPLPLKCTQICPFWALSQPSFLGHSWTEVKIKN